MSFLDTIRRAKAHLKEQGRVSLRALKLEFELDDEQLEALVEELVEIQQVGTREGKVVTWLGGKRRAVAEVHAPAVSAPAIPEAERRQLTVMFCDLAEPSQGMPRDAEDLREAFRTFLDAASKPIERHDGRIAQYLREGVLIYFGHPLAHEDDAERAVRAGLEILSALKTARGSRAAEARVTARIGIHTGPVVIGSMGDGAERQTLPLGDTANIATGLAAIAEPGSLVIGDRTLHLVPGMFLTQDLGTPPLDRIDESVHAYAIEQATGIRSRLDVDPNKLTPLVGRDHELALVVERWERAQEGEGQGILVTGEAGHGKSRLVQAFRDRLAGTPHTWLECRCTPYTRDTALQPSIELLQQGLGFKPGDDAEAKLGRLERGLKRAGLSLPETVPLIASLLSIPLADRYPAIQLSAELQRRRTMEALVAWTLGLAERQPLVMLYEDLHWCDPSTVELLGLALEQGATAPILSLLTFRPDFEPEWPARSHVAHVSVKRLSRRQTKNMIGGLTHGAPLPDAIVDRVVERADGVPLFVEELTKMVLESDLVQERDGRYELSGTSTDLAIPDTLQDSLMARLDLLGVGKEVAQLGSVIGREFSYPLVRGVSTLEESELQTALERLIDAELLYRRGTLPAATYIFKHAMIQDTAYQSLLRSARRDLHTRIAETLEREFPERGAAEPETLARHCDEAGLATRAIEHYKRAGEQAAERSANVEAMAHLGRALELLTSLPESRERDQEELELQMALGAPIAAARGWGDPECERAFERASDLASQIGEVPQLPRVLNGLATSYVTKGDLTAAASLAKRALEASERSHDSMDLMNAHYVAGHPLYWQGEFSRALTHFEQAIELYDPAVHGPLAREGGDRGANARAFAGWCHWMLGRPDQALATCHEAVALAEQVEHPISLAQSLSNRVVLHVMRREPQLAQDRADELIAFAEPRGFPMYVGVATAARGWGRALSGEGEAAVAEIQQGLGVLAQTGTGTGAPAFLAVLAEGAWRVGKHEDALGALALAVVRAEGNGQHFWNAELFRMRGEILLDQDPEAAAPEAEALFEQSLQVARAQAARGWELCAATSLARLWHRQDKSAQARDLLAPIYEGFAEGFATLDLEDARALLAQLG